MMPVSAKIGIGANLGDARDTVLQAIQRLAQLPETALTKQSSLYRSAPFEAAGDDYVNAVVEIHTELGALPLLHYLQELELAFGRERPYRNAPRTLDLDLLLYGDEQINNDNLTVPHPRITERAFVLLPLLQIDPLVEIPGLGKAQEFSAAVAAQVIQKIA
ncbi:MAG: 2-amino-4-hydroxy-6-hydroxymethyldihydropteridine diphosphokinase [Pseudomonadota bacterium]